MTIHEIEQDENSKRLIEIDKANNLDVNDKHELIYVVKE